MNRRFSRFRIAFASMLFAMLSLIGCEGADTAKQAAPEEVASVTAPPPAVAAEPAVSDAPVKDAVKVDRTQFADRVWRVKESSAVEAGTTYAFLADGTLVIDSPNGTPLHGQWRFDDGALTLVEEGQAYPTEILELGNASMRIRSHNPGEPVDMLWVAAPDVALPQAR